MNVLLPTYLSQCTWTPEEIFFFIFCSCCSHLDHRASVIFFVSLQFLILSSLWESLDRGSVRRKGVTYTGSPLPSSGQCFCQQIHRSRVRFPAYHIFWEVVGLERVPLSLLSTTEELLGRNSSGSGLENREYGRGDPLRWPRDTFYPQKLVLTLPKSCGSSVSIVHLRTRTMEFLYEV
jgi:hypothetical protein